MSHSSTTITSHVHRFPNSPQKWLTLDDAELTDTCRAFSTSTADPSASPTACTSTCKHITVTWFFNTQNLEQSIEISSHESPCTEGPLSVSKQSEVVSTHSCKKVKLNVQCNTEHRFLSELDYLFANTYFPACFFVKDLINIGTSTHVFAVVLIDYFWEEEQIWFQSIILQLVVWFMKKFQYVP